MQKYRLFNEYNKTLIYGEFDYKFDGFSIEKWMGNGMTLSSEEGWRGCEFGRYLFPEDNDRDPKYNWSDDMDRKYLEQEIDIALYGMKVNGVRRIKRQVVEDGEIYERRIVTCGLYDIPDWAYEDYANKLRKVAAHFYRLGRKHKEECHSAKSNKAEAE